MRKDVNVDDISSNIRIVSVGGFRAATVSLRSSVEGEEFEDWIEDHGLKATEFLVGTDTVTWTITGLTEAQVLLLKLTWSRADVANMKRTLG